MGGATHDDESLPLKPFSFQHVRVAFTQMKPHSLYGKQDGFVMGTKGELRFLRESIVTAHMYVSWKDTEYTAAVLFTYIVV